jgi:hypothetical protein
VNWLRERQLQSATARDVKKGYPSQPAQLGRTLSPSLVSPWRSCSAQICDTACTCVQVPCTLVFRLGQVIRPSCIVKLSTTAGPAFRTPIDEQMYRHVLVVWEFTCRYKYREMQKEVDLACLTMISKLINGTVITTVPYCK